MLERYPNQNWNMMRISQHPDLNIDWLIKLPQMDWNLYSIFKRKSFSKTELSDPKSSVFRLALVEDNVENLSILYQLPKQKVKINFLMK